MLDPSIGLGDGKMPPLDLSSDTEDVSNRAEEGSPVDHNSKNPETSNSNATNTH